MSYKGLSSGDDFLFNSAHKFLSERFQTQPKVSQPISHEIDWAPALHFETTRKRILVAEVSQMPYPTVFKLYLADIIEVTIPIEIYCVCTEGLYNDKKNKAEFKKLLSHGYGIIIVDDNGDAKFQESTVPLVQHIKGKEFNEKTKDIKGKVKVRVLDAFDKYQNDPRSGVGDLRILIEEMVKSAVKSSIKKDWLTTSTLSKDLADILNDMNDARQFSDTSAIIGGMKSFVSDFGNPAVHAPRSKKDAHKTYRECRYAFIDGLRHISNFMRNMKSKKITIRVS